MKSFQSILLFLIIFSSCKQPENSTPKTQISENQRAISKLNESLEQNSADKDNLYKRAKLHFDEKTFDKALTDINAAIQLDSINIKYHHLLADINLNYYRSKEALEALRKMAIFHPEDIPTKLKLIEFLIILKQNEEALAEIDGVIKLDPNNAQAYFLLGLIFRAEGDEERALNSLQRSVELDADLTDGWIILGNIYELKKDPIALQYYSNAVNSDDKNIFALHSKAFYLQNNGEVQKAINLYNQLLDIDPKYQDAHLNKAILHIEQDSVKLAKTEFENFRDLSPENPIPYFYLGVIAEIEKDLPTARALYQKTLEVNPEYLRATQALNRLNKN